MSRRRRIVLNIEIPPPDNRKLGVVQWADHSQGTLIEAPVETFNPEGYESRRAVGEAPQFRTYPTYNSALAHARYQHEQFRDHNRKRGHDGEEE